MEKYTFLEKLGRGTHGTVYLLKAHSEFVVCKSIPEKYSKYANREINILSQLNHRQIIKLIENYKIDTSFYLILEYANNSTLDVIISQKKKQGISINLDMKYQKFVWSFVSQIVDAIYYLHSKKIIHRDLKPANILINKIKYYNDELCEFKLCDFSLSTSVGMNMGNVVGTPFYMAPEIIHKVDYNEKVDIWSLGVIIYEMVALRRPFNGKTRKELQKNITDQEIIAVSNTGEDSLIHDIIINCLTKNFDERVSASGIRRIDRIRYNLALNEIKMKDMKIGKLEEKLREIESQNLRTPDSSSKKSI